MPRISSWKNGQKTNNFRFIDKQIRMMYDRGGVGIGIHMFLGADTSGNTGDDATQPVYTEDSPLNVQDLLFLENRDRKYSPDVYIMRGVYTRQDPDFDLSQFGIFLTNGTIFMTVHFNDMIETLGRKIISGDVIEMYHLKDDFVFSSDSSVQRYYQVTDTSYASEGFSQTWWPHLWRIKLTPMPASPEFKDITNKPNPYIPINEAILEQADNDVPASGYDTSKYFLYVSPKEAPEGYVTLTPRNDVTNEEIIANNMKVNTPDHDYKGWLTGDGIPPNGYPVSAATSFPPDAKEGDFVLRTDYKPNRLFRFNGRVWKKIEDNVRTNQTPGNPNNLTLRNSFANNYATNTIRHPDGSDHELPSAQNLSEALRPPKNY